MASSCTITFEARQAQECETAVLKFAWTADESDGSFTSVSTDDTDVTPHTTITDLIKGLDIAYATTNPGATAPTANYDITVTDGDGEDIFGGNLGNRSATATESAVCKIGSSSAVRAIHSALTLNITNNSVNSATGTVKLYLQKS
jgi:hypothetical protein